VAYTLSHNLLTCL